MLFSYSSSPDKPTTVAAVPKKQKSTFGGSTNNVGDVPRNSDTEMYVCHICILASFFCIFLHFGRNVVGAGSTAQADSPGRRADTPARRVDTPAPHAGVPGSASSSGSKYATTLTWCLNPI